MLSSESGNNSSVALRGIHTFITSDDAPAHEIESEIDYFLQDNGIHQDCLDLVILGMNGDVQYDKIYDYLRQSYFTGNTGFAVYKPLCGEYYTSSAFALWLATVMLKQQMVPAPVCLSPAASGRIKNVMIYNHIRNIEHSLMLVTAD